LLLPQETDPASRSSQVQNRFLLCNSKTVLFSHFEGVVDDIEEDGMVRMCGDGPLIV
jgi:hypothetical protein